MLVEVFGSSLLFEKKYCEEQINHIPRCAVFYNICFYLFVSNNYPLGIRNSLSIRSSIAIKTTSTMNKIY